MSLSHPSIRLYSCHFCFKAFISIDMLKEHSNCPMFVKYLASKSNSEFSVYIFYY